MKQKLISAGVIIARPLGARWILQQLNRGVRALSSFTHNLQLMVEWHRPPHPEWYDHYIDVHSVWDKTGNPLSWERGIFSLLAVKPGAKVLELCCGDGFNSDHFYAIRASSITALDFDPKAIKAAKRNFNRPNVKYIVGDIRKDMPTGSFENVIWDAAIEHFTEEEIAKIMAEIKTRLGDEGLLSGYTIVERQDGSSHHLHEYEFHSKEDLLRFLTPHFKNVRVFETIYPNRHNLYFWASDSATLPFDDNWQSQIVKKA